MLKDKWLTIALFTLSGTILLSGLWIKDALNNLTFYAPTSSNNTDYRVADQLNQLNSILQKATSTSNNKSANGITSLLNNPKNMYLGEAAKYLDVSEKQLKEIIQDPISELPYIQISDTAYIFNQKALDKWLEKGYILPSVQK
ncbi:helix-turn-helix domain-containing protein [Niameybacter massiliensis]|uniref:helix-turn-helix domain-containing protein n=1 Tax=Niameybacter massiliensis TaxID=1658108 RepID=UPI0006B44C5A|nr:helix-turn-helix domain-containing protein [Niameybacter massiliensis]